MQPHQYHRAQKRWRQRAVSGVRAAALALMMQSAVPAATVIWDGGAGTGAWGTGTNWSTNSLPANADSLVFNAASANNQYAITLGSNRTTAGITFSSAAGTNVFTFSGNTLTVNAGGITNNDAQTQTFNSIVTANSAQAWNAASGGLTFNNVTLSNTLTLAGGSAIAINGTLTNSGNRTITNNSSGTVTINNINLSNNAFNRTLTVGGTGATTVSGVISNASSSASNLTKTGTGALTLSGANTYTGATTVSAGTLALGASNVLSNSTAVTVASGATLNLNNYTDTVGSLAGAGTITLGSGTLAAGADNTSTTFSGAFTAGDTGTFQKTGSGTLTFGAGMDLSDGTLVLGGGTLNLGGYSSTVGTLSVTANSTLDFGAGISSVLTVLNALTVNSGVTLTIANWADTVDYFYSLVNPGAANLGRIVFSGFSSSSTTWQSFDYQVTPVPELKTYGAALLLLGLGFGAWQRARRNS
jgi:fibronectin-binding autotransporter adhesin